MLAPMRTHKQLQRAVQGLPNLSEFSRRHKLPLRTLMRIKLGGEPRTGTALLLDMALDAEAKLSEREAA